MTEESTNQAEQNVWLDVSELRLKATLQGIDVKIAPAGDVTLYTHNGVETKRPDVTAENTTDISISKDFNSVAAYGAKVEIAEDESLVVTTNGATRIRPVGTSDADDAAAIRAAKMAEKKKTQLEIGDVADDGWIYAGISPKTHKPMWVAPVDAGVMLFGDAKKEAQELCAEGKKDARLPSNTELYQLFNVAAKVGGFNQEMSGTAGVYWTSSRDAGHAKSKALNDAIQYVCSSKTGLSVRFVHS